MNVSCSLIKCSEVAQFQCWETTKTKSEFVVSVVGWGRHNESMDKSRGGTCYEGNKQGVMLALWGGTLLSMGC